MQSAAEEVVEVRSSDSEEEGKGIDAESDNNSSEVSSTRSSDVSSAWVSHNAGHIFPPFLQLGKGHTPEELVRLVYYSYILYSSSAIT